VGKRDIALQDKLAFYLLKSVNKAIRDYHMLTDGDRVAVGVSGGKDSLALLDLLRLRQRSSVEKYELVAVHVVLQTPDGASCAGTATRAALEARWAAEGQECAFETMQVEGQPDCFRCSYLRRKALFAVAERLGCQKLALGHHADDAAQTTLLNLAFHGRVETLRPRRVFFGGHFVLIRPLIYVPEKDLVRYARARALPVQPNACRRVRTSRRALVKGILRELEHEDPHVRINLFRAGLRGAECEEGEP
jgi:tRNA(Ile)-lysidine synthase TilS/MesJ